MATDFYDHMAEDTKAKLERALFYVNLAVERGDVAIMEKAGEVVIKIRLPKREKSDA